MQGNEIVRQYIVKRTVRFIFSETTYNPLYLTKDGKWYLLTGEGGACMEVTADEATELINRK
jgi:hypothetical protein